MNPSAQATTALPSIRDELERKAFEHIETLAIQLEHGKITQAQFDTGIRAIWACVSGLVDRWLIDTISEVKDRYDESFCDRTVLFRGESVLVISRKLGSGIVRVMKFPEQKRIHEKDCSDEPNPSKSALAWHRGTESLLKSGGYQTIDCD